MLDPWIQRFVPKTGMTGEDLRTTITTSNSVGAENVNRIFVDRAEIGTTLTQGVDLLWTNEVMANTSAKYYK